MLTTRIVGNVRNLVKYIPVTNPDAARAVGALPNSFHLNAAPRPLPTALSTGSLFAECKVSRMNDSLVTVQDGKTTSLGTTKCWSMGSGGRCCYGCSK